LNWPSPQREPIALLGHDSGWGDFFWKKSQNLELAQPSERTHRFAWARFWVEDFPFLVY